MQCRNTRRQPSIAEVDLELILCLMLIGSGQTDNDKGKANLRLARSRETSINADFLLGSSWLDELGWKALTTGCKK